MADLIINDDNFRDHFAPVIDGEPKGHGLIPRDYDAYPPGYLKCAPPADIALIPHSEWSARIKEMEQTNSRLSDIRMIGNNGQPIPAMDQARSNFCWAHSSTMAVMMIRAIMGLPYVPLSAYAVACVIKKGANQGGWGAQSLEFLEAVGAPSQAIWPQGDFSLRHDTPEMRANAALHKVTTDWADLRAPVYSRDLTFDQMMTLLLCRCPVIIDLNWWQHSVLALDPVEIEPGSFGPRIINSWTNQWGTLGTGVLQGQKAIPDGAVSPRVTQATFV